MKNIFLFFLSLSCIGLMNCNTTSIIGLSKGETLMTTNYKVIDHGYFIFLVFINDAEVKELIYHYSIDIKNKKVACFKNSETVYNIRDKKDYLKSLRVKTAEEFKHLQINTWREKYYICFSENFLDKANDEKIALLNQLCK